MSAWIQASKVLNVPSHVALKQLQPFECVFIDRADALQAARQRSCECKARSQHDVGNRRTAYSPYRISF